MRRFGVRLMQKRMNASGCMVNSVSIEAKTTARNGWITMVNVTLIAARVHKPAVHHRITAGMPVPRTSHGAGTHQGIHLVLADWAGRAVDRSPKQHG